MVMESDLYCMKQCENTNDLNCPSMLAKNWNANMKLIPTWE